MEECGAARPTGPRHAGSDGLRRLVDAAMHADTIRACCSAATLPSWHFFLGGLALSLAAATRTAWTPLAAATSTSLTRGMGQRAVAAPCGSSAKVWPPCSFSNKEPSKTSAWLPCSGHVPEQKRLPPRLADESNRSLQGSRQKGGLCCVRACVCDACVLVFVQALAARPT